MALSGTSLKGKIMTKLEAAGFDASKSEWIGKFAQAVADAVVEEITTNAQVTVNSGIAVATTGTAAAQTGNTTAQGTGTVI